MGHLHHRLLPAGGSCASTTHYVRERASQYMGYANGICSAEVDDFEADHLEFEPEEALSDTDFA